MDIWGAGVCGGVCGGGCLILSMYLFLRYNMNRPGVDMYTYIIYLTFDISTAPYSLHLTGGAPIHRQLLAATYILRSATGLYAMWLPPTISFAFHAKSQCLYTHVSVLRSE